MDQCWWLQPEPTALFLYKHKTKDKKKKAFLEWGGEAGREQGQERVVVWASVARGLENKGNDFKLKQKCRSPIQPPRLYGSLGEEAGDCRKCGSGQSTANGRPEGVKGARQK